MASQGKILGLILFSLCFGFFIPRIDEELRGPLLTFWRGFFQVMMKMTHLVMLAMPFGVFGLVAKVFATTGVSSLKPVGFFILTVIAALAIHTFIVLPLLLRYLARVNPLDHFRAMGPALFTAFSVSSSAATLPVTIDCVEKRVGISNRITSFTIPLATSMNLAGTGLYTCLSAFFVCQVYGVTLPLTSQLVILLMAFLSSLGMVPGIPSGSIVTLVVILQSIGLPADGVALIWAGERFLDMLRTSVNVFGNSCCAVLVATSEGERDALYK